MIGFRYTSGWRHHLINGITRQSQWPCPARSTFRY